MRRHVDEQRTVRLRRLAGAQHARVAIELDGESQPREQCPDGGMPGERDRHEPRAGEQQMIARAQMLALVREDEPLLLRAPLEQRTRHDDLGAQQAEHRGPAVRRHAHRRPARQRRRPPTACACESHVHRDEQREQHRAADSPRGDERDRQRDAVPAPRATKASPSRRHRRRGEDRRAAVREDRPTRSCRGAPPSLVRHAPPQSARPVARHPLARRDEARARPRPRARPPRSIASGDRRCASPSRATAPRAPSARPRAARTASTPWS